MIKLQDILLNIDGLLVLAGKIKHSIKGDKEILLVITYMVN